MKYEMNDNRMKELFATIDAQITTREKQVPYGSDRRQGTGRPPDGQIERRKGGDRRSSRKSTEDGS